MGKEQLSLDWNHLTEPPLSRRRDPATSQRAARRAIQFLNGHNATIVRTLVELGPLTAINMETRLKDDPDEGRRLKVVQIDRRVKDLELSGWIAREDVDADALQMRATEKSKRWVRSHEGPS